MNHLILVRHSISKPQSDQSPHDWRLTAEGEARCLQLAGQLQGYQPTHFYSSDEPKAITTANLLMQGLGQESKALQTHANFRETARNHAPFFDDPADFKNAIREAMSNPEALIYGEETFTDALKRFSQAVTRVMEAHPDQTTVIVSHGTILSLYIAQQTNQDSFTVWSSLDMPAYAIFSLPDMQLVKFAPSL